jgi:hypothetical protein
MERSYPENRETVHTCTRKLVSLIKIYKIPTIITVKA